MLIYSIFGHDCHAFRQHFNILWQRLQSAPPEGRVLLRRFLQYLSLIRSRRPCAAVQARDFLIHYFILNIFPFSHEKRIYTSSSDDGVAPPRANSLRRRPAPGTLPARRIKPAGTNTLSRLRQLKRYCHLGGRRSACFHASPQV